MINGNALELRGARPCQAYGGIHSEPSDLLEEASLADPRRAFDDHNPTATVGCRGDRLAKLGDLSVTLERTAVPQRPVERSTLHSGVRPMYRVYPVPRASAMSSRVLSIPLSL